MKLRIQFFAFLTLVILFPTTMWGQEPISNEPLPKLLPVTFQNQREKLKAE